MSRTSRFTSEGSVCHPVWLVLHVCPTRTAAFTRRQKRLVVRGGCTPSSSRSSATSSPTRRRSTRSGLQPQAEAASTGSAPQEALQALGFGIRNKRKNIIHVKNFLVLFLLPCLYGCDRLTDNEVKALKCELWRESGGVLNQQIYRDIAKKSKCVMTNDFGESLAIKARKGISMPCDPEEQDALLLEVNSICDSLLNQKQSE